jgi:hypothetical protein
VSRDPESWRARIRWRRRIESGARTLATAILIGGWCVWLSGCVVCWAILKPDGSGTLELTYGHPPHATEESIRADFSSPHVTVDSVTIRPVNTAVVRAHFDDITKLSTAAWFRPVSITRTRERNEETLSIVLGHDPSEPKDPDADGPQLSITLPGRILAANKDAEVTGNRVVWRYTQGEFGRAQDRQLTVRYRISS